MTVGQREAETQRRVVALFRDSLGYEDLGDWTGRPNNSNVEEDRLTGFLHGQGHPGPVVAKAVAELRKAADVGGTRTLYDANQKVYELLRYGVKVLPDVGEQRVTVHLVDWRNPRANDFVVAEEVTVARESTRRPDVVLYVNGIAVGVLELKRSIVSVAEGIRQNLGNQSKDAIQPFFATVQLVMAGNDTEGLRYGVIETPEKHWLRWKEAAEESNHAPAGSRSPLLRELVLLCNKERLLEIVHDFMVFDAGTKKTCRHNQYFGVRAAQERVRRREGGIIWHTQGSGKSLVMVWLAKWIRENIPDGRVLVVTDRTELDEQIEKVFKGVGEDIRRTTSAADLVDVLGNASEWLVCSLVHKFGGAEEGDIDAYVDEIRRVAADFRPKGQFFVFVDECHRTQSGKLHRAMKELLPDAMLIGFTGTPLLKGDKQRSIETFGPYIHTYKYDEAVQDHVVLDLRYEARDIDQELTSEDRVNQWFAAKTRGLTDVAKAQLKCRWGTMRSVLSSRERLERIVADIALDMQLRNRLRSGRGNAMLVSDSIYQACRLYEMFQSTELRGKCAVVTSYRPSPADIRGEDAGEGLTERLRRYKIYRKMLAEHFDEPEDTAMNKVERFEQEVKKRFVEQPGQMKLLIVVDKLLTGFDAPPATYLYIDKQMRDHGLFQAICRINRLDGVDKEYGFVIDYKDLFRSLEQSVKDYTGEAFDDFDTDDVDGLLKDRLEQGRERLEETREAVKGLCEAVEPPQDTAAYLRYFCDSTSHGEPSVVAAEDKAQERKRILLYRAVAAFARAYANLAGEMVRAGYSATEAVEIKEEVEHYEKVRMEVKLASGDYVDLKVYEPGMRHLLDTYIRAKESQRVSAFEDMTLVQLIVEQGEKALALLPRGIRKDPGAVAETIENNVRRLIVDEMAVNPKYYSEMSELLSALILKRKQDAVEYEKYLQDLVELARKVQNADAATHYPSRINSPGRRALYDNLVVREPPPVPYTTTREAREHTALEVDEAVRNRKKADWRGNTFKEREVLQAIKQALGEALGDDADQAETIFSVVKAQRDDY